jgi:hypothetical protein
LKLSVIQYLDRLEQTTGRADEGHVPRRYHHHHMFSEPARAAAE